MERDRYWEDFVLTGNIDSYLKYKQMANSEFTDRAAMENGDSRTDYQNSKLW